MPAPSTRPAARRAAKASAAAKQESVAALMRAIAMALPEVEEAPHFEKTSFRVRGKIFATAPEGPDTEEAVLRMAPEVQHAMMDAQPGRFRPAAGAWGVKGWTHVKARAIPRALLQDLTLSGWGLVAPKTLVAAFKR